MVSSYKGAAAGGGVLHIPTAMSAVLQGQVLLALVGLAVALSLGSLGITNAAAVHRRIGRHHSHARLPRIIHQSWKDSFVPGKYTAWQSSWKANQPGWEYWCVTCFNQSYIAHGPLYRTQLEFVMQHCVTSYGPEHSCALIRFFITFEYCQQAIDIHQK